MKENNNKEANIFLINKYIESLSKKEKEALEIAKMQLESSFNIEKSIGYLNWIKEGDDVGDISAKPPF